MGLSTSTMNSISSNTLLKKFVSNEPIPPNDKFWEAFLSQNFLIPIDGPSIASFEQEAESFLQQLRKHNLMSHNVTSLMQFIIFHSNVVIGSSSDLSGSVETSRIYVQHGLIIFLVVAKYLIEHTSESKTFRHFTVYCSSDQTSSSLLEFFFSTIFKFIVAVPVTEKTYLSHCAAISVCIVLLARQMQCELPALLPSVYVSAIWEKCAALAPEIVQRLMSNFAENQPTPAFLHNFAQSSFVWRTASTIAGGLLSIVTLGYLGRSSAPVVISSTNTSKVDPKVNIQFAAESGKSESLKDLTTSESPSNQMCNLLANLSSLLLLVLTTQSGSIKPSINASKDSDMNGEAQLLGRNPFRTSLFVLQDDLNSTGQQSTFRAPSSELSKSTPKSQPGGATPNGKLRVVDGSSIDIRLNFALIRDTGASVMHQDNSTLLLYLLIYRNNNFRAFLLQNKNYEKLLLPLLRILYRTPSDNSHLVYMALILLLIFTESESFGREIHTSKLKWVQWSPNRRLSNISYGSLIIMVLCRTIQYHLNQLKDKYLHVNILAALANLSDKVFQLHPYASDVLVGLLQLLIKRHNRTVDLVRHTSESVQPNLSPHSEEIDKRAGSASKTTLSEESLVQELSLLEEVIRMLLEIINSILTHALSSNSNLIYSLLYNRECLTVIRTHPSFQSVVQNIDVILTFFSKRIENELGPNPTLPDAVMAVIEKQSVNTQRSCNLKKFPDLKFKYVEEESPDEFFIPYVWSVVLRQSGIPFQTDRLLLFSPGRSVSNVLDVESDPHELTNDLVTNKVTENPSV